MLPDKYYVSFPYGLSDPMEIIEHRKQYRSAKNFYASNNGKTVQDNLYISFTFGKDEFLQYRKNVREGTGKYKGQYGQMETIPIQDRWSARFFELNDVFKNLNLEEATVLEIQKFYNIVCWEDYQNFIRSNGSSFFKKPPKDLFSYKEFNRVASN